MRIAYFDCFAGISGDMSVGALLSAGMPEEHLRSELEKLPLSGYEISTRNVERSMIAAVKFDVDILGRIDDRSSTGHEHPEPAHAAHEHHFHSGGHAHPPHRTENGHKH